MSNRAFSLRTPPIKMIFLLLAFVWILGSIFMPITQDEAYYVVWSNFLAWGYFDHPPAVAFMLFMNKFANSSPFISRLGTLALAILTAFIFCRLQINSGINNRKAIVAGLLLAMTNLMGLTFGFLTTPDTVLLFAWTWALNESVQALKGCRIRWLSAGLATGIGLLSKYTMTLIGPVFLLGLIFSDRKALRTAWPYAGGLVALLVFMPQINWNSENSNITFKFQLTHGLSMDRPDSDAFLPNPLPLDKNSPEFLMASSFDKLHEDEQNEEKKERFYDNTLKKMNQYLGYYASQLALWGFLFFPICGVVFRHRFKKVQNQIHSISTIGSHARPILLAAAAVPLIVFGLISLGSKVEANWSAMYIIGASVLISPHLARKQSHILVAAGANIAVLLLLLFHANTGSLTKRPYRDRILRETHGYENLSQILQKKRSPVFADSYQIASMVRFYDPKSKIGQWPGITRHSEFTRNIRLNSFTYATLVESQRFWLVTTDNIPPRIKGFFVHTLSQLRDCIGKYIQVIDSKNLNSSSRCRQPIHEWYLVKYEAN